MASPPEVLASITVMDQRRIMIAGPFRRRREFHAQETWRERRGDAMTIEEAILEKVRKLPPEKQREVLDFTGFLEARSAHVDPSEPRPPRKNLRGLWADLNIVSEKDIAEVRREMWQNFPREDIA
jgi:hypothetical protein